MGQRQQCVWGNSNTDNVTSAGTDECPQPAVCQFCSGLSVSVAAGARTMVLCPVTGAVARLGHMHACG